MGTTSGRFGRKFDIVVGRILAASVSRLCITCGIVRVASPGFAAFRSTSPEPEDFQSTYVAGMLGHSLVHKNRSMIIPKVYRGES